MNRHRLRIILLASLLLVSLMPIAAAHDQIPGKAPEGVVAVQGGTFHRVSEPVLRDGVMLIEDGLITAIGPRQRITIPESATVIEADGMNVYPGLINAYSEIGLREIDAVAATVDHRETGRLNPNVRSWVAVNPDSELIPVARAGGVLTSLAAPTGPYVAGQAGVLRMDGWTWQEMLLKGPAAMIVNWNAVEPAGKTPEERRRARAEAYRELDAWIDSVRRYDRRRRDDDDAQPIDLRLDAMAQAVVDGLPLLVTADRRSEIEAAVAFAVRHGLKLIIYGGYDAQACAQLLRQEDVPVILPGTFRLPPRRDDPHDAMFALPARLQAAGVRFCIAAEPPGYPGGASNARNLPHHAGYAAGHGLSEADALRAVTLSAAEILGVDDAVGSLGVGKEATFLIVEGNLLEITSHVRQAMIRGRPVDLGNRHRSLYDKYREKYRRLDEER